MHTQILQRPGDVSDRKMRVLAFAFPGDGLPFADVRIRL